MSQSIEGLVSGMQSLVEVHEAVDSVATSSKRRSEEAPELVRKERAEWEKEKKQFMQEIETLRATLKDQLEVSRAVVADSRVYKEGTAGCA